MYMKVCTNCEKPSYSATDRGGWTCPHCGKDLSGEKAKPAGPWKGKNSSLDVIDSMR